MTFLYQPRFSNWKTNKFIKPTIQAHKVYGPTGGWCRPRIGVNWFELVSIVVNLHFEAISYGVLLFFSEICVPLLNHVKFWSAFSGCLNFRSRRTVQELKKKTDPRRRKIITRHATCATTLFTILKGINLWTRLSFPRLRGREWKPCSQIYLRVFETMPNVTLFSFTLFGQFVFVEGVHS